MVERSVRVDDERECEDSRGRRDEHDERDDGRLQPSPADASTDGTYELLQADPEIRLFRHPKNQGKGAAIRTGVASWRQRTTRRVHLGSTRR